MSIGVFGAGSYGTALAIALVRNNCETSLWGRAASEVLQMRRERVNARYLPDCPLPEKLVLDPGLAAVAAADWWLLAVPSHALAPLCRQLRAHVRPDTRVAVASKGFEPGTGRLAHEVIATELGAQLPMAILSGPTFAVEVGRGLPSAVTVASSQADFADEVAQTLHGPGLRAYTSDDVVGVEVGGSVKNVIALGVGIADGLGLGANTRALLITRGLAEMMRLGEAMGGNRDTLMGLSGVGDLVLTCTDDQSRNRRLGKALGRGGNVEQAIAEIGQVVEGVGNAAEVNRLADRHAVDMPICRQVYKVLHEGVPTVQAVMELAARPQKAEQS